MIVQNPYSIEMKLFALVYAIYLIASLATLTKSDQLPSETAQPAKRYWLAKPQDVDRKSAHIEIIGNKSKMQNDQMKKKINADNAKLRSQQTPAGSKDGELHDEGKLRELILPIKQILKCLIKAIFPDKPKESFDLNAFKKSCCKYDSLKMLHICKDYVIVDKDKLLIGRELEIDQTLLPHHHHDPHVELLQIPDEEEPLIVGGPPEEPKRQVHVVETPTKSQQHPQEIRAN